MMRIFLFWTVSVLVIGLWTIKNLEGQEETPSKKETDAAKEEQGPLKEHRARFGQENADVETLAISAGELIKAGDQEWLRAQLLNMDLPEGGVLAIISAFMAKKDISVLPEVLVLSRCDQRVEVRNRCEKALGAYLDDGATRGATIKKLLGICTSGESSKDLLFAALQALGDTGDLKSVEILVSFVGHKDPTLLNQAVLSLQRLTYHDFGTDKAAWKNWWEENKHRSRDRIIEPVFNDREKKYLEEVENLKNQKLDLAFQLMATNPQKAVEFLTWDEKQVRRKAAEAISTLSSQNVVPGVLEKVISHLEGGEEDEETLKLLLSVLGNYQEKKAAIQSILLKYLRDDPRDSVKVSAAESLQGYNNNEVRSTVSDIIEGLKGIADRGQLKGQLLDLLAVLGSMEELDLIAYFVKLENEHDKRVREKAIKALGASGSEKAIDILKDVFMKEPASDTRYVVARSLARLGKTGPPEMGMKEKVVTALVRVLEDREPSVRIACIDGLGLLAPPNGLEIIQDHLKIEKDPNVRQRCIKALGDLRDPKGLKVICDALPPDSQNSTANKDILDTTKRALDSICGDNLNLWMRAVETFFDAEQLDLAISCCESFIQKAKGKNGDEKSLKKVRVTQQMSFYRRYYTAGNLVKALEHAKALTELEPSNRNHQLEYAKLLVKTEKFDDAMVTFQALIQGCPADRVTEFWQIKVEAARCLLLKGDAKGSLNLLQGFPGGESKNIPEELSQGVQQLKIEANARLEKQQEASKEAIPETGAKPEKDPEPPDSGPASEEEPPPGSQRPPDPEAKEESEGKSKTDSSSGSGPKTGKNADAGKKTGSSESSEGQENQAEAAGKSPTP